MLFNFVSSSKLLGTALTEFWTLNIWRKKDHLFIQNHDASVQNFITICRILDVNSTFQIWKHFIFNEEFIMKWLKILKMVIWLKDVDESSYCNWKSHYRKSFEVFLSFVFDWIVHNFVESVTTQGKLYTTTMKWNFPSI